MSQNQLVPIRPCCYSQIVPNTAAMHSTQQNLQNEWSTNIVAQNKVDFPNFWFFIIEKLRQLTNVVGTLSHKGIARRALPASGGKDVVGGIEKVNKGE